MFRPLRSMTGAAALALAVAAVAAAQDPADLRAATVQKAEAAYKDAFGTAHEKALRAARPAEKSDYARRLADAAAKANGDPAMQDVLRRYALQFAQPDAVGTAVAKEVYAAYKAFPSKRAKAFDKLAEIDEKALPNEPPANRTKAAEAVAKGYRDAAAEYEKLPNATAAAAAVGKARAVLKKFSPAAKEALAGLDADDRRIATLAADQADTDRLKAAFEKAPDDPKARVALGCRYVRLSRLKDAADLFKPCGEEWAAVAQALAAPAADPAALAKVMGRAAATLPADDRRGRFALLDFARAAFDEARAKKPEGWPALLPAYAGLLDRTFGSEPSSATPRLSVAILFAQFDLADAAVERGAFAEALTAAGKARAATRTMRSADARDFLPELDGLERGLKARIALDAEADRLKAEAKSLDAKGQLALGLVLLRTGKPGEAAAPLKASGQKPWQDVAGLLGAKDRGLLDLGNALRAAAADLKGEERADVLALARDRYEAFIATNPPDIDRTRTELVVNELPAGNMLRKSDKPVDLLTEANFKMFLAKGHGGSKMAAAGGAWCLDRESRWLVDMGRRLKVAERPARPDEVRYAAFAWKADGAPDVRLYLVPPGAGSPDQFRGYYAGRPLPESYFTQVKPVGPLPREMTAVVRDLFKDFGPIELAGFGLGTGADGATQYGGLALGQTPEAVRRALLRAARE